jgi:O-acetyl-ADP-ribose deacetylase
MITRPLPRLARPYDTDMLRIELIEGDITTQGVDAIVNAAKRSLMGGGGVDGAIHRRGGPAILEACREIRRTSHPDGLPTGDAVATTAGELAARWVIHTVGPVYGSVQDPAELLAKCHVSSLRIADELRARTIAFPAISTGVYGYPLAEAATVAIRTVRDAATDVERVRFVLFGADAFAAFEDALTNG